MCHASFQEMILWFPKCSIYAFTRAAAVTKEQITLTSYGHGYMYLLSLFGQMGGQGRWGAGAQITPNPVVLQLGQMGCNLSLGHKLQCLQTFACLWICLLLFTPWNTISIHLCWFRTKRGPPSGDRVACLMRCSLHDLCHFHVKGVKLVSSLWNTDPRGKGSLGEGGEWAKLRPCFKWSLEAAEALQWWLLC